MRYIISNFLNLINSLCHFDLRRNRANFAVSKVLSFVVLSFVEMTKRHGWCSHQPLKPQCWCPHQPLKLTMILYAFCHFHLRRNLTNFAVSKVLSFVEMTRLLTKRQGWCLHQPLKGTTYCLAF